MSDWLNARLFEMSEWFPKGSFFGFDVNLRGFIAVLLVAVVCGAVGSLVVGNRMSFFSDALAHCAFAGVALGLLLGIVTGADRGPDLDAWVTLVMVLFGAGIGLAIAFVRDASGQAADTVIGVFFAASLGLGAIFLKAGSARRFMPPEDFLFGSIVSVTAFDILVLLALAVVTAVVLAWLYNDYVMSSFNRSLALSRRARVRLGNYVFVVLLALIVNLSIKVVGVMLINALLIVPAATAVNLARNLRQLFWLSIAICVVAAGFGHFFSYSLRIPTPGLGEWVPPGESGTIVLFCVLLFFLSMLWSAWRQRAARKRRERESARLAISRPASENSTP
jgi:zinc transport system permease protein